MITRLVHLDINPLKLSEFVRIFKSARPTILQSKGCQSVVLLQDVEHPSRVSTLSKWETLQDLDAYRNTPFFRETWEASKKTFQARASATSYSVLSE